MVANTPQSRKSKGRLHQQAIAASILSVFPELEAGDVVSTSMGAPGCDIKLSPAAQRLLPLAFECKATESFNMYEAYKQASANAGKYHPVVVHRKSRGKAMAIIDWEYLLELHSDLNKLALMLEKVKNNETK